MKLEALKEWITDLVRITSFSHAKCDAVMQQRGIAVANAFNPHKSGFERDTVYSAFWFLATLEFFCVLYLLTWWRRSVSSEEPRNSLQGGVTIFALAGFAGLVLQLQAMSNYVETCRKLLSP